MEKHLSARLSALPPTIRELMSIAGSAGLALGVVHSDKLIHTANFGFRDYGSKLPVNDETIFPGCSLTKAMLSATMDVLVEEGALTWDTKVKDVLPSFHIRDEALQTSRQSQTYWLTDRACRRPILVRKPK